jgi:hypothetical protein
MSDPEDPGMTPGDTFLMMLFSALALLFVVIPALAIAVVFAGRWTIFLLERIFG